MGEKAARVPVQGSASAVPSAPMKPPFWYRYRAGVGALLLVNLGIGGSLSLCALSREWVRFFFVFVFELDL